MHSPLALFLRMGALLLCSASAALAATTPPKITNAVTPEHPQELMDRGISGRAKLAFVVTEEGTVADPQVVEATHPEFGEAAKAAVAQWTFEPARKDGEATSIKVSQEFKFEIPVEKQLEILAGHPVFVEIEGDVVDAKSLDEEPKALTPVTPVYPKSLAGSGKSGLVRLKFVINKEGQPVNPEIISSEGDPSFKSMAVISVVRSDWEPVQKDGKPVNVAMIVPIEFDEETSAAMPAKEMRKGDDEAEKK